MTDKEKAQQISVAYNAIVKVLSDTDEELFAYKHLQDARIALDEWYEEWEV